MSGVRATWFLIHSGSRLIVFSSGIALNHSSEAKDPKQKKQEEGPSNRQKERACAAEPIGKEEEQNRAPVGSKNNRSKREMGPALLIDFGPTSPRALPKAGR